MDGGTQEYDGHWILGNGERVSGDFLLLLLVVDKNPRQRTVRLRRRPRAAAS